MFLHKDLAPLEKHVYLSSPTMHGGEFKYIAEAYETNWMSTVGENIDEVERLAAEQVGMPYAVALCNCTSVLHLCAILAGEKLYGKRPVGHGALEGKTVFCSDMTFAATLNPIVYEGGVPVFIDTDATSWNMDPASLEKAFDLYPETKLVVYAELYGFPGRVDEIKAVCEKHGALLIEDAAEAMGATRLGRHCGTFGDYTAVSYNGNKIITGSSGGCFLTKSKEDADHVRKLSTQSKEQAPWYQHEEIGYNYRMSNVIAGVVRGQYPYLEEHIAKKKAIYERYRNGLADLPITINPRLQDSMPNFWLTALLVDAEAMCEQTRTDTTVTFLPEHGKSCPTEILGAIAAVNAEGRPIWKPMHLQPIYRDHAFVSAAGKDVSADIFARGACLPCDIKMTVEEQNRIIEAVRACFE